MTPCWEIMSGKSYDTVPLTRGPDRTIAKVCK